MSLEEAIVMATINGDTLSPKITASTNYKHWVSIEDWKRCVDCADHHGKVWLIAEVPYPAPPLHFHCRCSIELMQAIAAGTATINGLNGADWTLKYEGELPDYYISQNNLEQLGWRRGDKVSKFCKDRMLFGGEYGNNNGHLPQSKGRKWYEADINYKAGRRNRQRILWSNDGLIFVTYDHYETFYEII